MLYQVLIEKKVIVISARSGYEDQFPGIWHVILLKLMRRILLGDCHKWKVETFLNIKKKFDSNVMFSNALLDDNLSITRLLRTLYVSVILILKLMLHKCLLDSSSKQWSKQSNSVRILVLTKWLSSMSLLWINSIKYICL